MRIVMLALLLVACKGKSDQAMKTASCLTSASASCEDYDSTGDAYLKNRTADCKQIGGTWSTTACPTANRVGSCRETTKNWTRTRHYFVGGTVDLARTKIECGAFGKWLEPQPQ